MVARTWFMASTEPTDEIGESAQSMWETTLETLPRAGVAVAIIAVGWAASRAVRWALHRWFRRRQSPSFALVMSKVGGWALLALVVLAGIAVTFPSVKPVDLLAGLGFFSVAVGFAFQDILENTLSGMLLLFRQPFTSGDQIRVVDQEGTVEGITIRETRVRAYDGELIVIPNRDVYKNVIKVNTESPLQRQTFVVGVAYDADLEAATREIVDALAGVAEVSDDPAPHALVQSMGVSTIDIDVRFWTDAPRASLLVARDRAIKAVKARLDERGIEMPSQIIAVQATPSLQVALHDHGEVSESGAVVRTG